jgi:hypothetical protein
LLEFLQLEKLLFEIEQNFVDVLAGLTIYCNWLAGNPAVQPVSVHETPGLPH